MRVLHITDTHLFSDENSVQAKIHYENFINALSHFNANRNIFNVDRIIVTGDISHDGGTLSYELFFKNMDRLSLPYAVLPGNHDDIEHLDAAMKAAKHAVTVEQLSSASWALFGLNSVVPGEDYGVIRKETLYKLREDLTGTACENIAIFLHHHLIPVGTPLVDVCQLMNADDLLSICHDSPVKFIGTGHAHTLFQRKIGNILVSVSPALCSQWENGTSTVNVVNNSGFSIISFDENLFIETHFI
ncbi:metallophosphoesterase family protein [Candidatus Symbiopectobacterium sp. NZEC135]|uniref:metallophosphoesterase family protein n=1 Tax=Candidatus Symbiopectobacterium sp. NZEC135 TaxID=2820471 RepID=UPI0022275CF6|nr:metallophosphoesterase [Candidatus Symbiopectobacterium sp. NZEC135]MCW2478558.1 metallophosphoesterase [Candidatus Symbiopectobacterium sp. NZEC135]